MIPTYIYATVGMVKREMKTIEPLLNIELQTL